MLALTKLEPRLAGKWFQIALPPLNVQRTMSSQFPVNTANYRFKS